MFETLANQLTSRPLILNKGVIICWQCVTILIKNHLPTLLIIHPVKHPLVDKPNMPILSVSVLGKVSIK